MLPGRACARATVHRPLHLQHAATIARRGMERRATTRRHRDPARPGLRMTPQRRAIVAEIMRTQGHISPTAVARKVQGEMPGVNASTIYRTLTLLEEVGVLAHAHLESGAEYHRAEEAGHVHLTCSNCGRGRPVDRRGRGAPRLIERHHGFHPDLTHFAISGLCAECRARSRRRSAVAPLAAGDRLRLGRTRTAAPAGSPPSGPRPTGSPRVGPSATITPVVHDHRPRTELERVRADRA